MFLNFSGPSRLARTGPRSFRTKIVVRAGTIVAGRRLARRVSRTAMQNRRTAPRFAIGCDPEGRFRSISGAMPREFRVRLLECSVGGCLLESGSAIPAGTTGALSFPIDGRLYVEQAQIVRSQQIAGGAFHVAARIVDAAAPGKRSLRTAITCGIGRASRAPAHRAAK